MSLSIGALVGIIIGCVIGGLVIGLIIGIWASQKYFKKQLDENPPITKEQIKAMYQQMGRTPSESQINAIMHSMKRQSKKN